MSGIAQLINGQKAVAERVAQRRAATRQATVTSYDPESYSIMATLQPDGIQTGWMPLKSAWIGNGWGMYCPPSIGDTIEVDYQEDNGAIGSGGWRFYDVNNVPLEVPSGEFWLVHKTGSFVKLTNDGAISLADTKGATVELDGAGNVSVGAITLTLNAQNINSSGTWVHAGSIHNDGVPIDSTHKHKVEHIQTGGSTVDSDTPE